jgi:hypothetical protein
MDLYRKQAQVTCGFFYNLLYTTQQMLSPKQLLCQDPSPYISMEQNFGFFFVFLLLEEGRDPLAHHLPTNLAGTGAA